MKRAEGSLMSGVVEREIERRIAFTAHELKAPLSLVRTLSFALDATKENTERQLEIINNIRLTSERALRIVAGISQNYASQDTIIELAPLVANNLLSEIIREISPLTKIIGQKVEFLPQNCLPVLANRALLKSALLNLIDNSLKYNSSDKPIVIKTRQQKQNCLLSIENSAIFSRQDFNNLQENIGRKFQPISDQPLSSGIGLVLAKNFLQKMNGGISLRKSRKSRICFEINLPSSKQLSFLETL